MLLLRELLQTDFIGEIGERVVVRVEMILFILIHHHSAQSWMLTNRLKGSLAALFPGIRARVTVKPARFLECRLLKGPQAIKAFDGLSEGLGVWLKSCKQQY